MEPRIMYVRKHEDNLKYVRKHLGNLLEEFAKEIDAETMLQVLYENMYSMEAVMCNLSDCKCSEVVNRLYVPDLKKCGYDFKTLQALAKSSLRLEEGAVHTASPA